MKRIIILLITLLTISCNTPINNKEVIKNITNDSLNVKHVDILEVSNYYNITTDLDAVIKSSIKAWKNSPELGQYNRIKTIKFVTKTFIKKLNDGNYDKNDKVIAYQFIKSNEGKHYIGYTVVIFDKDGNQSTLYYSIKEYSKNAYYDGGSVNKLIDRGLSKEIDKIEDKFYK